MTQKAREKIEGPGAESTSDHNHISLRFCVANVHRQPDRSGDASFLKKLQKEVCQGGVPTVWVSETLDGQNPSLGDLGRSTSVCQDLRDSAKTYGFLRKSETQNGNP